MLQDRSKQQTFENMFVVIAVSIVAIFAIIFIAYLLLGTLSPQTGVNNSNITASSETVPAVTYSEFVDTLSYIELNGVLPETTFELADYYRYLSMMLRNDTISTTQYQSYQNTLNGLQSFEGNLDVTYNEFMDTVNHIEIYGTLPVNSEHELPAYYNYLNTLLVNDTISMTQFQTYLNALNLTQDTTNSTLAELQVRQSNAITPIIDTVTGSTMVLHTVQNSDAGVNDFVVTMDYISANNALPVNSEFTVADYYRDLVALYVNDMINSSQFNSYLDSLNAVEPFRVSSDVTYQDFMDTLNFIELNGELPANSLYEFADYYRYLGMLMVNETIGLEQFQSYQNTLNTVLPFEGNRDVTYQEFVDTMNYIESTGSLPMDLVNALPLVAVTSSLQVLDEGLPANSVHELPAYYSYLNTLLINDVIGMEQYQSYLFELNKL